MESVKSEKTKATPSQTTNAMMYGPLLGRTPLMNLVVYCTYTAGMLGLCNHVVVQLLRDEKTVKLGDTKT